MATGYNPPKYFTVKNSILKMLDSGELEANAPLPSERELMLSHDVSRITIRKAIEELEQEPESEVLIETLVQTDERSRMLHLCMEELHPAYREALYLVYFEGMRHAEAAAVMRKTEKQIADLVYRGKASLRKALEKEGITAWYI